MKFHFFAILASGMFFLHLACNSADKLMDTTYYMELHRPQFHFSPEANWMNDPNGMVYFEGEYHLFYQYYPDSNVWGPMHWGHAVSTDLVHWEHLPIALYPDSLGYIFSGSAVVDWNNTSGFGEEGIPPLVAIFTYHDPVAYEAGRNDFQTQGISFSLDKGRTWTKYEGNPVVPNPGILDFRDPKVVWDEDSGQWVMVFAAFDHVKLYGSPDLKNWQHLSDFGREWGTHTGVWECPDLFPIKVEGASEKKWVLLQSLNPGAPNGGSGTQYFVGDFDGKNFELDPGFSFQLGKVPAYGPEGELLADFEGENYGNWTAEGDAFGDGPVQGTLAGQNEVQGHQGQRLVNSFSGGDGSTGTLTSPVFILEKDYINFLIGGGNHPGKTCINLLVGDQVVRTATGRNQETLKWANWDVSELRGKEVRIQITDQHTGGWGHINVDQIVFADEPAHPVREKAVWLDYGRDNYAGVTWSDIPASDGRRIFLGWMSNWSYATVVPTAVWRSAMTLPRSLHLVESKGQYRLLSQPIKELEGLRTEMLDLTQPVAEGIDWAGVSPDMLEVELVVEIVDFTQAGFGLILSNEKGEEYRVGYDGTSNRFFSDRTQAGPNDFSENFAGNKATAPRLSKEGKISMHVFFDKASAELFADYGEVVMTEIFFPSQDFSKIRFYGDGSIQVLEAKAFPLEGSWRD